MGNRAEEKRQKRAYLKGYYAVTHDENRYKYGSATWHAWEDGWEDGLKKFNQKTHLTEKRK